MPRPGEILEEKAMPEPIEEQTEETTAEQRAAIDRRLEKMFRARPSLDVEGEPVLSIALDVAGMFLMAGTLNRGMALSGEILAMLNEGDDEKKKKARVTLSLASAQVAAFMCALKVFCEKHQEMLEAMPGSAGAMAELFKEEKGNGEIQPE